MGHEAGKEQSHFYYAPLFAIALMGFNPISILPDDKVMDFVINVRANYATNDSVVFPINQVSRLYCIHGGLVLLNTIIADSLNNVNAESICNDYI